MLKYYEPKNLRTLSFYIRRKYHISYDLPKHEMTFETIKEKEHFELFISKVETELFYLDELIGFYKIIMLKKENDISLEDVKNDCEEILLNVSPSVKNIN